MKKKVLIVIGGFKIGGTISSLRALLSVIDRDRVDVDVFSRLHTNEENAALPNCTILAENCWLSHRIIKKNPLEKLFCIFLWGLRGILSKLGIDLFRLYCKIGGRQISSLKYDAVIGYDESLARFISYLPAKKRITWIHSDYRRYMMNGKDETKIYERVDTVVCVSEFARRIFNEIYPKFSSKTITIHNVINVEEITKRSKVFESLDSRFKTDRFTLLSCGRFDPVKQFHLIPYIASSVREIGGVPFYWYIVGGGDELSHIQQEIRRYNVGDIVHILGFTNNVYAYMAKSDVYVCSSYSESYPLAVNEAKALGVPVISNEFPSVYESLTDTVDGYVVPLEEMPQCIIRIMNHPFKKTGVFYDNTQIVERFYQIL